VLASLISSIALSFVRRFRRANGVPRKRRKTMIKQTNPFYTINEAYEILKRLGADLMNSSTTYSLPWNDTCETQPERPLCWQEYVLSIITRRIYVGSAYYYVVEIHMDDEGFDKVCDLIEASVDVNKDEVPVLCKGPHSDKYDMYYIEPGAQLILFKLVPKEVTI
jgi:hypothetical protein